MIKKIQASLNSPIRITVVVALFSVLFTAGLSYIFNDGDVPLYGLGIALVCGTILPYWTSKIAYSYQEQLGEKNQALERLTSELQASNSDLEAYAHTVAHDLKTPLTVVMGAAKLLVEQQDGEVHVATERVDQVVSTDRQHVAVSTDNPDVEVGPRQRQTRRDRRRPAVDRVHSEGVHVVREPGRAPDAGNEHGVFATRADLGHQ